MEMPPSNRRPWMMPRVNIMLYFPLRMNRVWDSSLNTLSMDETDATNKTAGDDATSEPHFVLEKDLDSFCISVVALSKECDSILAVVKTVLD